MMKVLEVWLVFCNVCAVILGNAADPQRGGQFVHAFRAIQHRNVVRWFPRADSDRCLGAYLKNRDI